MYTTIPEEFMVNYHKWFDLNDIMQKYKDNDDSEHPLLYACKMHPIYYAYFMLGVKVRDYQAYELDEMVNNRFIFDLWGRRMGKSLKNKVFASWALWWNKFPSGQQKRTSIIVIAHEQGEADSYIEDIREMYIQGDARVSTVFNNALGAHYFTSKFPKRGSNAKNNTQSFSIMRYGCWQTIRAYPPSPRARGKGASVIILDEVAFWYVNVPNPEKIYSQAVRPVITDNPENSRIYASTTPDGRTGLAYELLPIDGHKSIFKLIWFPYYYRNEPAYLEELKNVEEEYTSQGRYNDFRQEYLAELIEQSESYFDAEKEVNLVFADELHYKFLPTYTQDCHFGLDFGGSKNSRTVITGVMYDKESDKIIRIFHKAYEVGKDSTLQEDIVNLCLRFPNIVKWHIDSQGAGSFFYGWFKSRFGSANVEEISFRAEKEVMYKLFKIACYKDRIKTYPDKDLFTEFLSFTRDLKPMKGYTDDRLDSFVMACKPFLEIEETTEYRVINY